jgi:aminopeptidase N
LKKNSKITINKKLDLTKNTSMNSILKSILISITALSIVSCSVINKKDKATVNATTPAIPEKEVAKKQEPSWLPKGKIYNPSRTIKNDLIHSRLEVSFDWRKQYLNGVATLTLKPYFYPQNTLELDARGFDLKSIKLKSTGNDLKYTYENDIITIQLDKTYTNKEEFQVQIEYTAKPNELKEGGSNAITSDKGLYFINPLGEDSTKPRQIWTQGETQANSAWFPTIDSPNEKHTQEIFITIENNFKTLSNGSLIYSKMNANGTHTDYWKQTLPHSTYLTMMAIGEYAIVKDKWGDMEVNYYVEPKYEPYAKKIFGNTPQMLTFFSEKMGYKYPWDKYSQVVVRDYVSGAMENTSASIFMEALQVDDRELIDDNWDGIIAHELFHHWFGDLVTAESWANLPLNESFADYSEYLWNEFKYGREEADREANGALNQYLSEARMKREPMIRYYYNNKEDMFDSHSYAKGGRILHMLRKYVGDDAFFKSLSVYLNKNAFKAAEIHHLRLAFEEVTGEDLNWFFNQWFMTLGHPEIEVQTSFADNALTLKVWQKQDTLYMPVYKLPLQIEIWTDGKKRLEDIIITKTYQEFTFNTSQPEMVIFDAENQLLGVIKHKKKEDELIKQYMYSDKYMYRISALEKLTYDLKNEKLKAVCLKALNDSHWKIRETAVAAFKDYSGEDKATIADKLAEMALKDKRSYVRATAIEVLATFKDNKYTSVYKTALKDSSYTVNAAALESYLGSDATDKMDVIKEYEKLDNDNIIYSISSYYAENGCKDASCENWFESKLKSSPRSVIANYAKYINGLDAEKRKEKAIILANMATKSTSWTKLTYYQNLTIFNDIEEVADIRKAMKENESSPMLKRIFEMIP